jgi:hypothetical protein
MWKLLAVAVPGPQGKVSERASAKGLAAMARVDEF